MADIFHHQGVVAAGFLGALDGQHLLVVEGSGGAGVAGWHPNSVHARRWRMDKYTLTARGPHHHHHHQTSALPLLCDLL